MDEFPGHVALPGGLCILGPFGPGEGAPGAASDTAPRTASRPCGRPDQPHTACTVGPAGISSGRAARPGIPSDPASSPSPVPPSVAGPEDDGRSRRGAAPDTGGGFMKPAKDGDAAPRTACGRARERPPNRRPNETRTVTWSDDLGTHELHVTLGLYDDGRLAEVFCRFRKSGSLLEAICDEACQLISRLLQRGCDLDEILRGLGFRDDGQAETPLGVVARVLVDFEEEMGDGS